MARIGIDRDTRDRLRSFGHSRMTYDEILRHLMDAVEREQFIEAISRRADQETDWVELDVFEWEDGV